MKNHIFAIFRFTMPPVILFSVIFSLLGVLPPARAAGIDVQPLTWNIIGLDSNKPASGPNHFPVGARVCNNTGADISVITAKFIWDSANTYINLRPGTADTVTRFNSPDVLANNTCADFYFEVEVDKNTDAYDTTRRYHIEVTSSEGGAYSTPTPRALYVEHLVSQSRNAVTDVQYGTDPGSLTSVPAGGTMALVVGQTYFIKLVGFTATQGYNQLESFINFPNTIFQVISVESVYSAPSTGYSIDKMYSDACGWDNVISSPTYRSCIVSDDKTGGDIVVTYEVKILKVPDSSTNPVVNPEPLSTLIYDFSGSSYHYNADFGISTRYAYVLDATAIDISKSFSPATIAPGSTSTLTFTLKNNAPVTVAGVSFTDGLPDITSADTTTGQMIADPATYSASGCGMVARMNFASGDTSLSFSNGAIAPNGTCTISVSVSVPDNPTSGNYQNISGNVFVDDLDSGHHAEANLSIDSSATIAGAGLCGQTLAEWTFPSTIDLNNPVPDPGNIVTAQAQIGAGLTPKLGSSTHTTDSTVSWGSNGSFDSTGILNTNFNDYFEFAIDTTGYSKIELSFWAERPNGNAPTQVVVYSGTTSTPPGIWKTNLGDGSTTLFPSAQNTWESSGVINFDSGLNPSGLTYFRIYGAYAKQNNSGADLYLDDVLFTGCGDPIQPAITKAFSPNPVMVGGTSTLAFTISNSNSVNLTNAKYTDTLPSGLEYDTASTPSTTCGNSPSMTFTGNTTFNFGQTTGATIPPAGCIVSVDVIATTAGPHQNISDFIYTTEGGTNSDPSGSAKASLVAVLPPTIDKNFSPSTILANETSTLTFIITNPNPGDALSSNVDFSDTLPAGMTLASDVTTPQCGGAVTGTAGTDVIGFSKGTIPAGGSCSVTVEVTASGASDYVNTSGIVTITIDGVTKGDDTATATLTVKDPSPAISILKRVSTSATGPWSTFLTVAPTTPVFYQFTVENTGDVDLANVSVSDPTLTGLGLNLSGCTWATLARYTDAVTCVTASTPALSGNNPNTATAQGTYTIGGTTKTAISSASYVGVTTGTLNLSKQISTSSSGPWSSSISDVAPGSTIYYKFTIVNATGGPLTSINVTDIDPDVDAASCTFTGPLPDGGATTCIVPATVSTTSVTKHTNTATAHGTDGGSTVVDSPASSADYTPKAPDLTVTKSNNTSNGGKVGTSFTWTISVENTGTDTATFADGQTILSDPLPVGATYTNFSAPLLTNLNCALTTSPGAITCTASGGDFSIASTDSFDVTVDVTPTAAGDLTNTATVDPAPPVGGNINETDEGNNSSTDTVTVLAPPSIAKSFLTNPVVVGDISTLRFTITNSNSTDLTGVAFSDTLPTGMTLAADATTPQCGGIVMGTSGSDTVSLSNGSIAANSNCTLDVTVKVAAGGRYDNTSGPVSSTNGGTGNTASDTLKVFDAMPIKEIVATSEASTGFVGTREKVAIGEMVRYRISAQLPEGSFTNLQFADNIPNGLQFLDDGTAKVAFVCNDGCITSTTITDADPATTPNLILNGASSAVSPEFDLPGSAISGGSFGSGIDVTFSLGDLTNSDNDSDNEYVVIEFNVLVLNVNDSVTINQGVDNDPSSPTAGQSDANWRINTAALFVNSSQVGIDSDNIAVEIAEPAITVLNKSETSGGSYLPGTDIQYTLSLTNNAIGDNATTAFDIQLSDTLDGNLTPGTINISSTQGTSGVDACAGGTPFIASSSVVSQAVTVDVSCLDVGKTVTVEVNATIKAATAEGTTISNAGSLTYASLPGTSGNCGTSPFSCDVFTTGTPGLEISERDGSGDMGADDTVLNNYATQSAAVDITVSTANDLPVANDDSFSITEDTLLNGDLKVDNGSGADVPSGDGGNIWSKLTDPSHGTVTFHADGTFSYTPDANYNGSDSFTYQTCDVDGDCDPATVNITIDPVDDLPTAVDDNATINEDTPVTINELGNDSYGGDGANATAPIVLPDELNGLLEPAHGTVALDNNSTPGDLSDDRIVYTPDTNYNGTDSFEYQICDVDGDCDTATVDITIGPVDDPVTADYESYSASEDTLLTVATASGVLPGDSYPDGFGSLAVTTDVSHGTLVLNTGDGSFTYMPDADWSGTDSFEYEICDADSGTQMPVDCDTGLVTITIVPVDDVPVANDDSFSVTEDTPLNGDLKANNGSGADVPSGDGGNVWNKLTDPSHGTVTVNADGTFNYTPDANYNGSDSFTYQICDVNNDCDPAIVNLTITSVEDPAIGIAKDVVDVTRIGSGTFDVTLEFNIRNYGDVALSAVQVTDDLSVTFPAPVTFTVQSVTVSNLANAVLTANPGYNGNSDTNLLTGAGNTLSVNGSGTIMVVVRVIPSSSGPFDNVALTNGNSPASVTVTDDSSDGTDPDNTANCSVCVNGDGDPTNNTKSTPINFDPNIFDPPFGFKDVDASGLPVLHWTMIWINDNNFPSSAAVSDPIPAGVTYEATGAASGTGVPAGAPSGSTDVGVTCAPDPSNPASTTTTTWCYYEGPTGTYPRGRIVWEGVLGPDAGATNQATANDELYITFAVHVGTGVTTVQNTATIDADLNNNGNYADPGEHNVASTQASWQEPATPQAGRVGRKLPATGFAPGKFTFLPNQTPDQAYADLGGLWLEIPSLGIKTSIVGVPTNAGFWDIAWLGEQAGWLQGTAFPTWQGNSVITGHVYLPNGKPGPFVDLSKLRFGDQVIVHAFSQRYIYEVRVNQVITPEDMSPFKHEEKAWLTLLTCKGYDESSDTYKYRVEMRAVLVKVTAE